MIPAIVLEPQNKEIILDLCAAPGSKSTLLIEMMYGNCEGSLVCNEIDCNRAYMLAHQIKRYNCNFCIITKKDARFFSDIEFDKVLIDVPCTGDGAIRKIY